MKRFRDGAEQAGELVGAEGLASPEQARIVRAGKDGAPEVTDGPFAETKEFLAGYWIVDVESPERAYEIAARASAAPGTRRRAAQHADRGARGHERAAGRGLMCRCRRRRWTRRSSTCCASSRRRCSAPSSGGSATSPPPRTPCRRRCIAAAAQWPRGRACPTIPRGWLIQVAARRMTDQVRSESRAAAPRGVSWPDASAGQVASARTPPMAIRRDRRRHAHAALHVLPSRAHAAVGDRADAARGRRPDDRRDRAARSSSPKRRWPSGSAARSRRIKSLGRAVPNADRRGARRAARAPCCTCSI